MKFLKEVELSCLLNEIKNDIICVRGNCDSEVDQMVLKFPMRASSGTVLLENGTTVYLTHGHLLDSILAVASMEKEKVCVLYGHTHVPECTEDGNIVLMNPGSVSIPKENSHHGYIPSSRAVRARESSRHSCCPIRARQV